MVSTAVRRALRVGVLLVAAAPALGLAACTSSSGGSAEPDDGSTLTLWSRSQNDKAFADLYNKTHKNKVQVTVVPGDNFLQKVGSAAGSGSLPDLLVSDVVYGINYATQGVYADITDRVSGLTGKDQLVQAHLKAATVDNRTYAVPHFVDLSMVFYNKELFRRAGLDPNKFPTNFDELYRAAAAIHALGKGVYGFALQNTPGGWAYQTMSSLAAAGQPPLKDDGATVNLDNDAMRAMLTFYRRMFTEGILPPTTRSDLDAGTFPLMVDGKAGMGWAGNWFGGTYAKDIDFEWGVAPWPAVHGGASSGFVGGDVIGVTAKSKHQEQAWNFIQWTLSDEAQREVLGKRGLLPVRTDLANDQTWSSIPHFDQMVKGLGSGYTPSSLPYGEIFNVPTGPWFRGIEAVVYEGADIDQTLAAMQKEAQGIVDKAYK